MRITGQAIIDINPATVTFLGGLKRCGLLLIGIVGLLAMTGVAYSSQNSSDKGFEQEWQDLIKAAQEEGKVVIAYNERRHAYDVFEKKFGIKVVMTRGRGSQNANRILAERAAGRYTVDVSQIGSSTSNTRMIPAGAYDPIKPLLIHPEVTDESLWYGGKHHFADPEEKYLLIWNAHVNTLKLPTWYNTKHFSKEDILAIRSPWDFLTEKWKGKLVSLPPDDPGAQGSWFGYYVRPDMGPKWIRTYIQEMDVFWTADERAVLDGVAFGKFGGAFAAGRLDDDLEQLRDRGMPVDEPPSDHDPGEVKVLSAGGGTAIFAAVNRPPHPNAQKLFLNWVLSREGQTAYQEDPLRLYPTLREDDIPPGKTYSYERRKPDEEYLLIEGMPELTAKRKEAIEFVARVFRESQ
jgi:ABC-type Fe3+ transport system substrate-binding protein